MGKNLEDDGMTNDQTRMFGMPEEPVSYPKNRIKKNIGADGSESWMDSLPKEARDEIRKARAEAARWRIIARKSGKDELAGELEMLRSEMREKDGSEPEEQEPVDYKGLYEQAGKEKSEMEAKYSRELAKLNSVAEEYEAERRELLEMLPLDLQEPFVDCSRKQLQLLLARINRAANSPGAKNAARSEQDIENMSLDEQLKLNAENPELFNQLKAKQFQKRRMGV